MLRGKFSRYSFGLDLLRWTSGLIAAVLAVGIVSATTFPTGAVSITIPSGPHGNSDLVGALAGKLGVTPSGTASYSVPISVPPGTAGVQPSLVLQYSSTGGSGIAGIGWSIGGLSAISRCPATKEYDGFLDPVDFDSNDKLCMNGSRLVPVSGSYMADGTEYRTSFEGFTKIISYGTVGSGPEHLKAWQRSGEVFEYGVSSDSRMETEDSVHVKSWMLNKITDRSGNYISFTYSKDVATGEQRLTRVDYTGNAAQGLSPYNYVEFTYEDRPDDGVAYRGGSVTNQTKRLTTVTVHAEASVFRTYNITYRTTGEISQLVSIEECAGSSTCLPATTFDWAAPGIDDTDIGFSNYALGSSEGITGTAYDDFRVGASGDFNGDGLTDFYIHKVDDYGRSRGKTTDEVWLSDGDGTFTKVSPGIVNSSYNAAVFGGTGDFNGDGLTDLYIYKGDQYGRREPVKDRVWLSNGDGTFTVVEMNFGAEALLHMAQKIGVTGDFNGDGLTDLFWYATKEDGRKVPALLHIFGIPLDRIWLSNGDGTFTTQVANVAADLTKNREDFVPTGGDFNGDGLTDIYWFKADTDWRTQGGQSGDRIWTSVGDGTFTDTKLGSSAGIPSSGFDNYKIAAATDFNRDGLTDLFFYRADGKGRSSGTYAAEAWLSTGDHDFDRRVTSITIDDDMLPTVGDYNGDGFADVYFHKARNEDAVRAESSTADYFWINTNGYDFVRSDLGVSEGTTGSAHEYYAIGAGGDFDGDGATDLYFYRTDNKLRSNGDSDDYVFFSTGNQPGQITSVVNGLGLTTEVDYTPMTDASVYTKGSSASYPVYDITSTQSLVSAVRADNGIGGQNQQTYTYESLQVEVDKGSLGFAKMTVMDDGTGIKTVSEYSQDHTNDKQGLLSASQTIAPNTTVLEETTRSWTVQGLTTSDGTPRRFRYAPSMTTTKRDLDGTLMSTVATATTYNTYGFPTQVTNTATGDGNTYTSVTDNTYGADDAANWLIGRVTAASVTQSATGTPDIVRSSAYSYDATTGHLLIETIQPGDALSHTSTYVRNGFGLATSLTETWGSTGTDGIAATSRVSSYTYDSAGRFMLTETNPLSHTQTTGYHSVFAIPETTTGPNGLTTDYDFDDFGRTVVEERADGTQTRTYRYLCDGTPSCPANAILMMVLESDGAPTSTVYQDILGRTVRTVTATLDGSGSTVDTVFDALGRATSVSNPYFDGDTVYQTAYTHDVLGRVTGVTNPDGSTRTATFAGRTVTKTNELGQSEIATVDALGRQVSVTDAQSNVTAYGYDAVGQPISVTDASANVTTMAYDIRGNKIAMSDPDMGSWTYRTNALGLLVEQLDAKGQVTAMSYDTLGRMLTRTDDATGGSPEIATWSFDTAANGIGKLAGSSNANYAATPAYDAFGRPSQTTETIDGTAYTVSTAYDAYSRPQTLTYPSGFAVKNIYNASGHLSEMQYASSGTMLWRASDMDARGNITSFQLGNGATSQRVHDVETGRISSIYSTHGSTVVQDLTYQFDDVGNLTSRSDARQNFVENAVYDTLNRVIQANATTGVAPGDTGLYLPPEMWSGTATSISVTYDVLGNITSKTDIGAYAYGTANGSCASVTGAVATAGPKAVSSVTGTKNDAFCYDANGNLLSALDSGSNGRTVAWTAFNKPETIVKGSNTVDIAYGPDRARVKRIDTSATSTTTTRYVGGKLYEDIDRAGVLERKHYIGGFAVITTTVSTGTSEAHYLLGDHLGSTDTVMNASGVVVERMSFDPWGKRRQTHWVPINDPAGHVTLVTTRGYTGHEQLDPVGLVHMNGRVYHPEIGRFLSADPYVQHPFNGQSLNRYSYGLNNPLSFTDPTGFYYDTAYPGEGGWHNGGHQYGGPEPNNSYGSSNYSGGTNNNGGSSGSYGSAPSNDYGSQDCGCGSYTGSGVSMFDPTPIASQNVALSGGIVAGSPVASTSVQTASYFGPTNASVPGYDSSQFEYSGTGYGGQVASVAPASGYWGAGVFGPFDVGNRHANTFLNSSASAVNSILNYGGVMSGMAINSLISVGELAGYYGPTLDGWSMAAMGAPALGMGLKTTGTVFSGAGRLAARVTGVVSTYYPSKNGFIGSTTRHFLMPGQKIDRYGGSPYSRFFSPTGTPGAARALPPSTIGQPLRTFEVVKPFEVNRGSVAPWFGQPGGGTQFVTPVPLGPLLNRGILKEVTP